MREKLQLDDSTEQQALNVEVVVVGGGPSGATAANDLARKGVNVVLLDRDGRVKPCGGAIPPQLIREFDIPNSLLCARIGSARMIAPSGKGVDMPVESGFVGMVNREVFDEFLRQRAVESGARRVTGTFTKLQRNADDRPVVVYKDKDDVEHRIVARLVIGADGARSKVAKQALPNCKQPPSVFAYHEVIKAPNSAPTAQDRKSVV